MDNRGQAIGIARYALALIVGAVMIWIIDLTTDPILDGAANATSNSTANQATTWIQDWITWLPIMFLLISFVGLIVYSVFIREAFR